MENETVVHKSAFPTLGDNGMALLDYFAGQAMIHFVKDNNISYDDSAINSYRMASAMLEERQKYLNTQK